MHITHKTPSNSYSQKHTHTHTYAGSTTNYNISDLELRYGDSLFLHDIFLLVEIHISTQTEKEMHIVDYCCRLMLIVLGDELCVCVCVWLYMSTALFLSGAYSSN